MIIVPRDITECYEDFPVPRLELAPVIGADSRWMRRKPGEVEPAMTMVPRDHLLPVQHPSIFFPVS